MSNSYTVSQETREGVEVFTLEEAGRAAAEIAPGFGNNCFSFRVGGREVIEPIPFNEFLKKPTSYGNPILFPFPNRIRDGRFTFGGERFEVNPPRHGFVRDKAWRAESSGASDADGAWLTSSLDAADYPDEILAQFPFPFRLEVTYRVRDGVLRMETVARNTGERPMPVGFGIHPYFRKPSAGTLTVPAAKRWELSESLPTGRLLDLEGYYDLRRPADVNSLALDDIYTEVEPDADGLARGVIGDSESGTEIVVEFSPDQFPHVVVYTTPAPRRAVCVEPNTCPTDAFNLQERGVNSNVLALGAGDAASFDIRFYTRPSGGARG